MKAGEYMDVTVHMPTTFEGMEILACRINEAHLKMVTTNINKLGCPYEQKVELWKKGEITKNELISICDISESTFYRRIRAF